MKKILVLVLTILLVCSLFNSVTVLAESYSGSCGENLKWSLDTETGILKIEGTGAMNNYHIDYQNPDNHKAAPWEEYSYYLKTVIVEEGVSTIGKEAFKNCRELENIILPKSVKLIDNSAFESCDNLVDFSIPDGTLELGDRVFYNCLRIKNITVSMSVSKIGSDTFLGEFGQLYVTVDDKNVDYLSEEGALFNKQKTILYSYPASKTEKYSIPSTVTKISDNAFIYSQINEINIPSSVKSIGKYAFEGSNIKALNIPNSVIEIGEGAFCICENLKSVTISNGITKISKLMFSACRSLTSVTIPHGVTTVEDYAFQVCDNLKEVHIPQSVTSIGVQVFESTRNVSIYGNIGSYAQTYANANKIKFVSSSTPHKHSYNEWANTRTPTCTDNGSMQRVCSSCGSVETKTINAFGHNLENIIITKEATISETGIKEGVCKNCKQTIKETIPCSSIDDETGATFETVEGVLDSGAEIKIKEIKTDSETYKLIQNSLKEITTKFVAYDITTVLNGAEIQPNGSIKITLKIPDGFSQNVVIYYVSDDGEIEKLESTVNADGTVSADITHFSSYVICDLDSAGTTDSDNTTQKPSNKNNIFLILAIITILIAISVAAFVFIRRKNEMFKKEKR